MRGHGKIDLTRPNSTDMAITFDSVIQFHQKLTFSESSHHNLCLVLRRSKFPHCFSNDVIVTLEVRFLKISLCILVGLNCAKFHWASLNSSCRGIKTHSWTCYLVIFLPVNTLFVLLSLSIPLKGCATCKSFEDFNK